MLSDLEKNNFKRAEEFLKVLKDYNKFDEKIALQTQEEQNNLLENENESKDDNNNDKVSKTTSERAFCVLNDIKSYQKYYFSIINSFAQNKTNFKTTSYELFALKHELESNINKNNYYYKKYKKINYADCKSLKRKNYNQSFETLKSFTALEDELTALILFKMPKEHLSAFEAIKEYKNTELKKAEKLPKEKLLYIKLNELDFKLIFLIWILDEINL